MQILKPLSIAAGSVMTMVSVGAFAAQPATAPPPVAPPVMQAAATSAQPVQRRYTPAELDTDHNGMLSRAELPLDVHVLRRNFVRADLDGNGQLSTEEIMYYATGTAPTFVGISHAFTVVNPYPDQYREAMKLASQ